MKLGDALVLAKTKVESVDQVRNLNLWGNGLTDVELVTKMPLLEMLSLSVNQLSTLRPFARCAKLTELHLRKNEIADLDELRHLVGLRRVVLTLFSRTFPGVRPRRPRLGFNPDTPRRLTTPSDDAFQLHPDVASSHGTTLIRHLRVLWLCDNPCAEVPGYRARVVLALPRLEKLDNEEITEREREEAAAVVAAANAASPKLRTALKSPPPSRSPPRSPLRSPARKYAAESGAGGGAGPTSPTSRGSAPSTPRGGFGSSGKKGPGRFHRASASTRVLYAVMALVADLDEEGLKIVQREVDERLEDGEFFDD
ncbi:uncharacterized protein MICPUCDRAFT_56042 [Micromonas pusilla CCMP1545]|uniref:Predicted protein n=1 Tax=Micromonas pusilla (strain CCMP1545) TaxID=564608 RepID=C1MNV1_MICPC|nr:uncharacterized protein MICPUCDRAFT_56042 [Micromonas pusilla CCMP1545]EEH58821.1 predicted protein [Micromonas pusilla CCMP1545]|eukprot:XP_003057176.1 predicted protein [Micromonas pusilla CCMP1545]